MSIKHVVTLVGIISIVSLSGCATTSGCDGAACQRPDASRHTMVVWWPEDMRGGPEASLSPADYSEVRLP